MSNPERPDRLLYLLATGRASVDESELFEAILQAEGLAVCPPELLQRARRLARHLPPQRLSTSLRQIQHLARLAFDSWQSPRLAPVRAHLSDARQILLQADEHEITLHIEKSAPHAFTILGQVLGRGQVLQQVFLLAPTLEPSASAAAAILAGPTAIDDLGEFQFAQVPPGSYIFSVQSETKRIDSPPITLDTPAAPEST